MAKMHLLKTAAVAIVLVAGTTGANAQSSLSSWLLGEGAPVNFWANGDAHTIVAVSTAKTYEVCNVGHDSHYGERASVLVDADGKQLEVGPGRCSHVEGATITVKSSAPPNVVSGSFRVVN